jgi:hypothetical protein
MLAESRVLRLAEQVAGSKTDALKNQLERSKIQISVDSTVPNSSLTTRVLLTTLSRLPGRIYLDASTVPNPLAKEFEKVVFKIRPERPLVLTSENSVDGAIHLHIGAGIAGAINLVPEGYGGHIIRGPKRIRPKRPANGLGAIYTAALGAAEAFKTMADVLPARRIDHEYLRFCPVSLSTDLQRVPDLNSFELSLTLAGLGAVGSGIALILSHLPFSGKSLLVDREHYAIENVETYSLGGASDIGKWKTDIAASVLTNFETASFNNEVSNLTCEIDAGTQPAYPIVLSGMDNVEARYDVQRLWPQVLIDAGTGDTMLGFYDACRSGPCLMCFLPTNEGPSATERLAEITGLSLERLSRGDDILTADDLIGLSDKEREKLLPYLGAKVCGLAQAFGLTNLESDGYQPAVPFVSLQAACLSVGRLISILLDLRDQRNLVQYDALIGPNMATIEQLKPVLKCYCQERSTVIQAIRTARYGSQ